MAAEHQTTLQTCAACGSAVRAYYMCDREETDAIWCDDCFAKTPCGRGDHGEGCPTYVFEGGNDA